MYYQGTPFVESSKIEESELSRIRLYFVKESLGQPFCEEFYKRVTREGELKLIIYSGANPQDKRLHDYHRDNFGSVPFHVEQTVSEKVIKTTAFTNFEAKSIRIFIYDDLWRTKFEQWYDENFNLIEYRQLYYKGDGVKETPYEERIFFATNWTTLTENYGD